MKKLSILAASLMLALAVQAEPGKSEDDLVLPVVAQASHHATASKRITALFTRSHYVPMQLDDELSGRIFDMYLKIWIITETYFFSPMLIHFHAFVMNLMTV